MADEDLYGLDAETADDLRAMLDDWDGGRLTEIDPQRPRGLPAKVEIYLAKSTTTIAAVTIGLTRTGSTTSGSPNITSLSATDDIFPGATITGTGIPASTTVLSITDGTTIVLSANATASASVTLTFGIDTPGSGAVEIYGLFQGASANWTSYDRALADTGYNMSGSSIASGTWALLAREPISGRLLASSLAGASGGVTAMTVRLFTANGTWTKPAGLKFVEAELVAGGGAGGGGNGIGLSMFAAGSGGGPGGYGNRMVLASSLGATEAVTIGAGGIGTGFTGGNGGNSSFGSWLFASGGIGGTCNAPVVVLFNGATYISGVNAPGLRGAGTQGDIYFGGFPAGHGIVQVIRTGSNVSSIIVPGTGGSTPFGNGEFTNLVALGGSTNGQTATPGTGAGGSGGMCNGVASPPTIFGGNGASGLLIVREYT